MKMNEYAVLFKPKDKVLDITRDGLRFDALSEYDALEQATKLTLSKESTKFISSPFGRTIMAVFKIDYDAKDLYELKLHLSYPD